MSSYTNLSQNPKFTQSKQKIPKKRSKKKKKKFTQTISFSLRMGKRINK